MWGAPVGIEQRIATQRALMPPGELGFVMVICNGCGLQRSVTVRRGSEMARIVAMARLVESFSGWSFGEAGGDHDFCPACVALGRDRRG